MGRCAGAGSERSCTGSKVAMPLEGELTIYLASGKKKHSRVFWVDQTSDTGLVQISWGKSLRSKKCKTKNLIAIEEKATMRDPRTMFDEVDDDGSGSLDPSEVALLYKKARGESLTKKELKTAMTQMDTDGDNQVQFEEFERWWRDNGGDLAKHTERAMTIQAGDLELLLVAPTVDEKQRWVRGCQQLLRSEAILSDNLSDGAITPVTKLDLSSGSEGPVDEEDPSALLEFMVHGQMLQMYLPNGKLKHERFFSYVPSKKPLISWAPRPGGKGKTAVIVSVQLGTKEASEELQKFARTLMTMVVKPEEGATKQELLLVCPDRRARRLWFAGCQHLVMATTLENPHVARVATSDSLTEPSTRVETGAAQAQLTTNLDTRKLPDLEPPPQQQPASAPHDLFDWVEDDGLIEGAETKIHEKTVGELNKRRPKYPWDQLSTAMREAAGVLGYTRDRWPSHSNDAGGSWPHWDELSDGQKQAAGVLGIKARDWHSEKLQREVEVVYANRGRIGIGFAKGTVPLRVSSISGSSQGQGVEVGMRLSKVQGQEAVHNGPFDDAVAQLAEHAKRRPLVLVFANTA